MNIFGTDESRGAILKYLSEVVCREVIARETNPEGIYKPRLRLDPMFFLLQF